MSDDLLNECNRFGWYTTGKICESCKIGDIKCIVIKFMNECFFTHWYRCTSCNLSCFEMNEDNLIDDAEILYLPNLFPSYTVKKID